MVTSALAGVMKGASPVGSSFASMKAILVERGIIKTAICRAPFRTPTAAEARAAVDAVASAGAVVA